MATNKALIAATAVLALGAWSSAWACYNDCSPGFWKNHFECWYGSGLFCETPTCRDEMLAQLMPQLQEKQKGPASGLERSAAAAVLNAWADRYYGYKICTE